MISTLFMAVNVKLVSVLGIPDVVMVVFRGFFTAVTPSAMVTLESVLVLPIEAIS